MSLSPEANLILTALLTDSRYRGIRIRHDVTGALAVWLPETQDYDKPDGTGDSVSEALEDAAHHAAQKAKQ